jgi:hypothetical protein
MTMKQETVWTCTFTNNGNDITVTMTSPQVAADGSRNVVASGTLHIWERPPAKMKVVTFAKGVIGEATYRVDGLDHDLSFTTGWSFDPRRSRKTTPNQKDIVITSLDFHGNAITSEALRKIPISKLLAAALRASAVRVIHYPTGYKGPSLAYGALFITTGPDTEIGPHLNDVPAGFVESWADATDVLDKGQRLQRVADVWHTASHADKTFDVVAALCVGDRQARRLISEARDAGLIPPVSKTDQRSRKATK